MDAAELVAKACPQINAIGPAFYFVDETLQAGKEIGLDGYRFYHLGRGGVLGDVESGVVASAFGYFDPDLVRTIWNSARERTTSTPQEVGRRYFECSAEFGRRHFQDLDLEQFCDAAERVNDAADPAGLALYAGISAEQLADDPPARAMQLCTVLREFRGSAHLVAILATPGIDPRIAHGVRRPDFWTLFGYDESDRPEGTDEEHAALAATDVLTDQLVAPAFGALADDERTTLLDGLTAMESRLPEFTGPRG